MQPPLLAGYDPPGRDELLDEHGGVRGAYAHLARLFEQWGIAELRTRQDRAEAALLTSGVTFGLGAGDERVERIFPFDLIPRVIAAREWAQIERGLIQRVRALNAFLGDVYGERRALHDGVIPAEVVLGAPGYQPRMNGFRTPLGVYAHIVGTDLVRGADGRYVVLEDNLRTPSGVSYVLENRAVMLRVAPELFAAHDVAPVSDYPTRLRAALLAVRPPRATGTTTVVVLTPGMYNSAYFEHSFLAQQMGVELAEPSDLVVHDEVVYLRATSGLQRVDVVYRRIDDEYLDPLAFDPDSLVGVPGIFGAYQAGNVTLVNAPGAGVADDKLVFRWVPELIRYYLHEEPVLDAVPTLAAIVPEELAQIREHARDLVLKPANASGGAGIVIGAQASDEELRAALERIEAAPREWIAQPLQEFSTIPTIIGDRIAPRRADLRPYVITAAQSWVLPGALCRVALAEGSYIVNSSRGGGSKDTWVLTGASAADGGGGGC